MFGGSGGRNGGTDSFNEDDLGMDGEDLERQRGGDIGIRGCKCGIRFPNKTNGH